MDFRDFMQPRPDPATPEEAQFRDWMRLNRDHFLDGNYTPDDVGILARLVGFSAVLVYRELSNFRDALFDTNIDNRIALQSYQFESAIKDFKEKKEAIERLAERKARRKLGMDALWRDVARNQSGPFWRDRGHTSGGRP